MGLIVFVDCYRGLELIATYDFLVPDTAACPKVSYDRASIESQVKGNLSNDRLAFPPFSDVTMKFGMSADD